MPSTNIIIKLFIIFLCAWGNLCAQENLEVLRTDENTTFEEVKEHSGFMPIQDSNLGLQNGVYWLKVNRLPSTSENIIRIKGHHVTEATAESFDGQSLSLMGNTLFPTFSVDPEQTRFPIFIKLKFNLEANFPVEFLSPAALEIRQQSTLFSYGLFYGALFFVGIMNVILFLVTKEKNFWTYAALLFSVGVALAFRDNLSYLFDWDDQWVINIELLSHVLVGVFGGFFAYSFIDLKHKNHSLGKLFIFGFGVFACISMLLYWAFNVFIYYALADVFIFLCIVALWIVSFVSTKKSRNLLFVFGVYAVNIYFILEFLVLYNFGISLLSITPLIIKLGIVADMIILSVAIFQDWQKLKEKSGAIMEDLKLKVTEIEHLSQYKRQDDLRDDYLENLIENFDLTNREVKILQMLSADQEKSTMANILRVSRASLDETIESLYLKLGIQDKNDITAPPQA